MLQLVPCVPAVSAAVAVGDVMALRTDAAMGALRRWAGPTEP